MSYLLWCYGRCGLSHDWVLYLLSDVVVQIVDARNPLLFRCEDLVSLPSCFVISYCFVPFLQEKYVKEIKSEKVNVVLISKSDLLTLKQR